MSKTALLASPYPIFTLPAPAPLGTQPGMFSTTLGTTYLACSGPSAVTSGAMQASWQDPSLHPAQLQCHHKVLYGTFCSSTNPPTTQVFIHWCFFFHFQFSGVHSSYRFYLFLNKSLVFEAFCNYAMLFAMKMNMLHL